MKDSDILIEIGKFLSDFNIQNLRLSGILYLHRITDQRLGGATIKNLAMFEKLVGKGYIENVILLTTMWSNLISPKDGEKRVQSLTSKGKFWVSMINLGAMHERYDGTNDDAYRIVRMVLNKAPIVLRLQKELASGKKIADTAAGKEVTDRLEKLQAKQAEEIAALREQIAEISQRKMAC